MTKSESISSSAAKTAIDLNAKGIIVCSESGTTAQQVVKFPKWTSRDCSNNIPTSNNRPNHHLASQYFTHHAPFSNERIILYNIVNMTTNNNTSFASRLMTLPMLASPPKASMRLSLETPSLKDLFFDATTVFSPGLPWPSSKKPHDGASFNNIENKPNKKKNMVRTYYYFIPNATVAGVTSSGRPK